MKENLNQKFEKIYGSESDAIFRFCLIRVSNKDQALDITQETFLRLWKNFLEDKEIFNTRAFLFTVAHRLVIDWYRKKKSLSLDKMMSKDDGHQSYDIADENIYSNPTALAEARYLMEKINDLSPNSKHSVYLRFIEGLSASEIGDVLHISPNSASVRVHRGLLELQRNTGYLA